MEALVAAVLEENSDYFNHIVYNLEEHRYYTYIGGLLW